MLNHTKINCSKYHRSNALGSCISCDGGEWDCIKQYFCSSNSNSYNNCSFVSGCSAGKYKDGSGNCVNCPTGTWTYLILLEVLVCVPCWYIPSKYRPVLL